MKLIVLIVLLVPLCVSKTTAQETAPFISRKEDFLKLSEHNVKIWSKAQTCAKSANSSDQLLNCQLELKKDRKQLYEKKVKDKKTQVRKV